MLRFITQRLFTIALTCVFIVFAVYLGMGMASNSDVLEPSFDLVQRSGVAWDSTLVYLEGVLRGDLGILETSAGPVEVRSILWESYRNSLGLLLIALAAAAAVGFALGGAAALSKKIPFALPILTITIIGISIPSFFAGMLLQQVAIVYLRETGRHLVSVAGIGWDLDHMIFPLLVLGARPLAYLTRTSFLSLNRIMEADFIRTAYAKGLRPLRMVINIHALRNIAVPIFTAVGVSLRFSLSTLPVVEYFFAWPGIGLRLLEAINERQTVVVVTLALALGLTLLLVNLILDVLYRLVDPRIQEENG
ncbi:MAG: ABC transporter permease [Chloroflexi bacterium]|nr:ABC transporter permease [Chloroflexota bacterium]